MIVSKGAQKKTVPDVRGKSEADARSEIQAAGLTVGSTSTQHDDSVAKGNVISQSVTPGKKVSAGTAVNAVCSPCSADDACAAVSRSLILPQAEALYPG